MIRMVQLKHTTRSVPIFYRVVFKYDFFVCKSTKIPLLNIIRRRHMGKEAWIARNFSGFPLIIWKSRYSPIVWSKLFSVLENPSSSEHEISGDSKVEYQNEIWIASEKKFPCILKLLLFFPSQGCILDLERVIWFSKCTQQLSYEHERSKVKKINSNGLDRMERY